LQLDLVGDVVGLDRVVRDVVPARAAELVAAAAGHHVDAHAAGLLRRVGAARDDLHLLEHVEVVVDRRCARGRHVGDVHAVNRHLLLPEDDPREM